MKVNTNVKAGDGSSTNRITANHNEKQTKSLIVKTGIKAGDVGHNHNEKLADNDSRSPELKKSFGKKLRLSKETVKKLRDDELKWIPGGAAAAAALAGGAAAPRTTSKDFDCCAIRYTI